MREVFAAVVAAVLAQTVRATVRKAEMASSQPDANEIYPSIDRLRIVSDGYATLVADYYWVAAVSDYGDKRMHRLNHPNLGPLLERALALDPLFYEAYLFAGLVLTIPNLNPALGMHLLQQGEVERPDKWKLGFVLGFNHFFVYGNKAAALEALQRAARLRDAPSMVVSLATAIGANIGQASSALGVVEELLRTTEDKTMRSFLEERRQLLLLEIEIAHLNDLAHRFEAMTGRKPRALHDLVAGGLLDEVRPDPLGGSYGIDSNGSITTSTPRLRLEEPAPPLPAEAQ